MDGEESKLLTAGNKQLLTVPLRRTFSNESLSNLPVVERNHVVVGNDDDISQLVGRLFEDWKLPCPDIIITLIGGTRYFRSWKQEGHRTALQKGILKVVNATETWIMDPGLNYGLSKIVGDAVRSEMQIRRLKELYETKSRKLPRIKRHEIVLMGIVPLTKVSDDEEFAKLVDPDKKAEDAFSSEEKFGINPHHTNFILLDERYADSADLRVEIEIEFARQAERKKQATLSTPKVSPTDKNGDASQSIEYKDQVPLIGILIQGGHVQLDQLLAYANNQIPVLVISGTGRVADIVAFAYKEFKERGFDIDGMADVRPEILRRITRALPGGQIKSEDEKVEICEKIMQLLALSRQQDRKFLHVLESGEDLVDIDECILPAIFGCRPKSLNDSLRQIRSDYLLTMKLNKPSIAESKVISRDENQLFQIDNELFEKSLVWRNREKFVERAMETNFCVHKFLSHSRLLRLFRNAEDSDFFNTVVWERIPRHLFDFQVEETFVTRDLRILIQALTGVQDFISMFELSSNCFGKYVTDASAAERRALNALIVWAVLFNRFHLAKTLLKFHEDPIPTAIFISSLYRGLRRHTNDPTVQKTLADNAKAFSIIAIEILDMSYRDSSLRTFDLLNRKFPDYHDSTPVALAYASKNKYFLAHEACQIWLNQLWEGGIEVTGRWNPHIPQELKLVLSACLLFPIPFWIRYPRKNFEKKVIKDIADESAADDLKTPKPRIVTPNHNYDDHFHLDAKDAKDVDGKVEKTLLELRHYETTHRSGRLQRHSSATVSEKKSLVYADAEIPFWRRVYYLWASPRTKFWVYQLFYWVYLGFFSVITIHPTCERTVLDIITLIWATLMAVEIAFRTVTQSRLNFPLSMTRRVTEVALILGFVISLAVLKIFYLEVKPYYVRIIMTVGLIYMYYRMVTVFFPMHSMLGPMLYRIQKMITVDFVSFMKLVAPFLLANMFALQAILYPDMPYGWYTWRKGFHRAFFNLFAAVTVELDYTPKCEANRLRYNETGDLCWVGDYSDPMCPTIGWPSYLVNIQYLIITRLILVVLLNALFAATMIKVKEEVDYIYRYQRYRTVLDFASRPALPPPLSVLSYCFNWTMFCWAKWRNVNEEKRRDLVESRAVKLIERKSRQQSFGSYSYWRNLTKEYFRKKQAEEKSKNTGVVQDMVNRIKQISDEQKAIQTTLNNIAVKLSSS